MSRQEAETTTPAPAPAPKSASPWPALIAVIVLMPAIAFATTQYLLIPNIRAALAEQGGKSDGPTKTGAKSAHKEKDKAAFSYEFKDIVVNLSGAMGTRYLKASFTVFSSHADLQKVMAENKTQLLDTALGVLSAKSLNDLETAGSKNLVRNDLIASFNRALNSELVEQIYFSEFVVQ
jgi:flagellar protein FliL